MKKTFNTSIVILILLISSTANAAPTATNVPNATADSVQLVDKTKSKIPDTDNISSVIETSWSSIYYDFYGEPGHNFTVTWQKIVNGKYVTQQVWENNFDDKGQRPGSWAQGANTSWKVLLEDSDNGSSVTYTYTIGNRSKNSP
ncbi:hypothetical protein ABEW19_29980 [Paenibacillus illinoisensis]|uniref:hypothetical protein n=1 Tax=Paenibacillus illinoisensis TaxID=59845 RepID=UPI003D2CABE1